MKYIATVDGRDFTIDVDRAGEAVVDGAALSVDLQPIDGQQLYSVLVDRASFDLHVERRAGVYYILIEGDRYAVDVEDARLKQLKAMGRQEHAVHGSATVAAPMPGLVVRVMVAVGDTVAENQGVAILEAMKMENEIRSPRAGVVKTVQAVAGNTVNQGDALLVVGDGD
jgi:biotin carboxyl carrier protein